jgi:hypothetical protein
MSEELIPAVWVFNINCRVYRRDAEGKAYGGPIWREHWMKREVVGQTRQSWITSTGLKVPKSGGSGIAFSEEEIDRLAYVEGNRRQLAERVRRLSDYDTIKKIEELLGRA